MNNPLKQSISMTELSITGKTLVPDQITAVLGMPPTRSFKKGDVVSQRSGGTRPWGLWAVRFEGTDIQEDAVRLLNTLRGKEAAIRTLIETPEVQVSIAIWWEPSEGHGGFTVESATFAQLCALSTRIHVYFPGHPLPQHQN